VEAVAEELIVLRVRAVDSHSEEAEEALLTFSGTGRLSNSRPRR
jgi:hypothetical protein